MDAHPAPFPGKRRIASKYASKTADGTAVAKKTPWQNVTAAAPAQIRPKRSFGVPRSTNVLHAPMERPLFVSKPRKIPPSVKSPPDPDPVPATKTEAKVSNKKKQQVSFLEPKTTIANPSEENEPEEVVRTPMPMIKPAVSGTPYLTAQNCSKCKLDELESSDYWLAQIRLAESTGKHFVSAAFFRLALECHAQPSHKLRSELRHYVTRHPVNSTESIWTDLYQDYGLEKEKLVYYSCDLVLDNSLLAEMDDEPDAELCCPDESHVSLIEKDDSETTFDSVLLGCEANKDGCPMSVNVDQVEVGQSEHVIAEVKYNHCHDKGLEKMEQSESLLVDTLTNCSSVKDNLCDEKELDKIEQTESLPIDALTNFSSTKDNLCDEKELEKMEQSESLSIDALTNCSSTKDNPCDERELEKLEQSESLPIDALTNCSSPKDNLCVEKELEKLEQSESSLINNLTNCYSVKDNHCDGKELEKMEQSESRSTSTNCCSAKGSHCEEKELETTQQSERQSIDTITGSNCCTVDNIPCNANKPLEGTVSELKSCGDSFNNKSEHRSNNSFQQKKVPASSSKGRGMLSSRVSAKIAVRIGDGKYSKNRSDQITGKNKRDGNVKAVSKNLA